MRALTVVLLLCATPAYAQNRTAAAREHYKLGVRHFDLGEFDAAESEFKAAYELSGAPGLLFNIGQSARLKGDLEGALHSYQRYVRALPDAPNRKDADELIADVERQLFEKQRGAAQPAPPVHELPPRIIVVRELVPVNDGRAERRVGLGLGLGGAAITLVGVYFAASAASASSDVEALAAQRGNWSPQFQQVYTDGQSDATKAKVLMAVGGAVLVGGGVLYYLGWRRGETAKVGVAPAPGGAQLSMWGRF